MKKNRSSGVSNRSIVWKLSMKSTQNQDQVAKKLLLKVSEDSEEYSMSDTDSDYDMDIDNIIAWEASITNNREEDETECNTSER